MWHSSASVDLAKLFSTIRPHFIEFLKLKPPTKKMKNIETCRKGKMAIKEATLCPQFLTDKTPVKCLIIILLVYSSFWNKKKNLKKKNSKQMEFKHQIKSHITNILIGLRILNWSSSIVCIISSRSSFNSLWRLICWIVCLPRYWSLDFVAWWTYSHILCQGVKLIV